jgi:hypothetical protein
VHERDRRFLLTLGKLALALATTGVIIALAVRWLPSLAQIAVVVPVGTALIFGHSAAHHSTPPVAPAMTGSPLGWAVRRSSSGVAGCLKAEARTSRRMRMLARASLVRVLLLRRDAPRT